MKLTAALRPIMASFSVGDPVKVIAVANPELPHHACFLNKTGRIARLYKTRACALLEFPDGTSRECYITNIRAI